MKHLVISSFNFYISVLTTVIFFTDFNELQQFYYRITVRFEGIFEVANRGSIKSTKPVNVWFFYENLDIPINRIPDYPNQFQVSSEFG